MSGWGRFTWGQAEWGEDELLATGWGAKAWGAGAWGDLSGEIVQPTGLSITSTLNDSVTISGNAVVAISGQQISSTLGTISNVISVTVDPNGLEMNDLQGTAQASIDVTPTITGLSTTAAIGVIDPKDQVVGLTGLSITSTLGAPFIIHYQDVDTGSNTNYSNVSTGSNTSYSSVATGSNTSYNDVAA